jgi:hypothetical protein
MAGYGDADEVMRQLERTESSADYAAVLARVGELNASLSRLFDSKCNRTNPASETRTVQVGPSGGSFWFYPLGAWPYVDETGPYAGALILPTPVLTVSAVKEGGTWDGAAWDDETTLAATDYRLTGGDAARGYYRVERLLGPGWGGPVRITGTWIDAAWTEATVPPEVVDALTFLVVSHYREEMTSPAGVVGPDGLAVPTRNPWGYERVKEAINRYRVYEVVV